MEQDEVDINREDRFLNWWGIFLIILGVVILAVQGIWIALGVILVVVGNNCRLISVIRAGMRHLSSTTVASIKRLGELFWATKND